MMIDITLFVICALVITFSGTQLSKQGNILANLTGLSKAWIGLILMATVTSLPELVTSLSSVVVVKAPDLAAGNVLGSCAFNLLILSLLDLMVKKPIIGLVKTSHLVTGSFSIIMLAFTGIAILVEPAIFSVLWVSPFSILMIFVYVVAMRSIFVYEKVHPSENEKEQIVVARDAVLIKKALGTYSVHALVVTAGALFLPYYGNRIAEYFQVSDSFFGTVFLAIATSLPEIVVSISAVKFGSLDMAMGNLLGSNVFNVAILALTDFFYPAGSLYQAISQNHLLSIFSSIVMTAVVAIGLVIRPERKTWHLGIDAWIILLIYGLSIFFFSVQGD
jgi:cation:H+ antiporter